MLMISGVMSLGALVSADSITVPEEPKLISNKVVYYATANTADDPNSSSKNTVSSSDNNDGLTVLTPKGTYNGTATADGAFDVLGAAGGTIVITGKSFMGAAYVFETVAPVLITAIDPESGYDFRDYNVYADEAAENYGNGQQNGAFILKFPLSIEGEIIIDDTYMLSRENSTSISVTAGSKLVIGDGVGFYDMSKKYGAASVAPTLEVKEGGYAYLHAVGFSAYVGTGTIVLGDELLNNPEVTASTFDGFAGNIVDKNGNTVFSIEIDTTIPAEPKLTASAVGYIANGSTSGLCTSSDTNDGLTPQTSKASWLSTAEKGVIGIVKDGGTIVSTGKGYVSQDYTLPMTTSPVLITAKYGSTDYRNGEMFAEGNDNANGTQRGTLLLADKYITLSVAGHYILDDIDIYSRYKDGASTIDVRNKGILVIGDGAEIYSMAKGENAWKNSLAPVLNVSLGGTAYLHNGGFSAYTGDGNIVVDKALIKSGELTEDMFAGFNGTLVDEDGNAVDFSIADDGNDDESGSNNPDTGDTTLVFAALSFISCVTLAAVVVIKKRA